MTDTVAIGIAISAVVVFLWGFERYRTRFVKSNLLVATALSVGLLLAAFAPQVAGTWTLPGVRGALIAVVLLASGSVVLYLASTLRDTRRDLSRLVRNLAIDRASDGAVRTDGGEKSICVVVPAYNEANTIQSVVTSLPESIRGYRVEPVVVSDGSEDETANRANVSGVTVVEHPLNQGQGGALRTGFEVASRRNAEIVVTMDGDGQHPVTELERLVSPVLDGEADYVMGSRYKGTDRSGNSLVRQVGIHSFTWLINLLTKSELTDCTNGFRAIRGDRIDELTLTEKRFSAPELIIEARKNGLRIVEIPITVEERQAGETKKPKLGYAIGLTRTILVSWIR